MTVMPNLEGCLQLIWECKCVPNCMRKKAGIGISQSVCSLQVKMLSS